MIIEAGASTDLSVPNQLSNGQIFPEDQSPIGPETCSLVIGGTYTCICGTFCLDAEFLELAQASIRTA